MATWNKFYSTFLKRFLPKLKMGEMELNKVSMLISFILVTEIILFTFSCIAFSVDNYLGSWVNLGAFLALAFAFFSIRKKSLLRFTSYLFLGVTFFVVSSHQLFTGYFVLHNVIWLPMMATVAVILLGRLEGLIWTLFITLMFTLVNTALYMGIDIPQYTISEKGRFILDFAGIIAGVLASYYLIFIVSLERKLTLDLIDKKAHEQEDLLREKEGLISLMSHDISNPLSIIKHCLKSMTKENGGASNDSIARIDMAVGLIQEIIESVRRSEALKKGKLEVETEQVSLDDVFRKLDILFGDSLKAKELNLVIDKEEERDYVVKAEALSLTNTVLSNLISNAIKFSQRKSDIMIRVRDSVDKVHLWVVDQGVGVPDEMKEDLFRQDRKTTRPGTEGEKGTGFGLPLVHQYMKQYGGKISVSSVTEEEDDTLMGTTFHLVFDKWVDNEFPTRDDESCVRKSAS